MATSDPFSMNLAIEAACNSLMGFVLISSNDDADKARFVIADMIRAHHPADTTELNLITQIVGFGLAAMDSLRRSIADPDMPDTKVLRYRTSAASLSRSAEQCRAALNALRAAANPAERPPAPTKPRAAAPVPTDDQKEKAAARARALLNRLDQLHEEWDQSSPIPMPAAPAAQHLPSSYG